MEPNYDQAHSPYRDDDALCAGRVEGAHWQAPCLAVPRTKAYNRRARLPLPPLLMPWAGAQLYPDPDWSALRIALGTTHDIAPSDILCGNGSMELIASLTLAFANPQNAVLAPAHAYPFFQNRRATGASAV